MSTPGWYADPHARGFLRWWDGVSWTAHVQPAVPVPSGQPPDPGRDLAEVLKAGRLVGTALLVAAGLVLVTMLGLAAMVPAAVQAVRDFVHQVQVVPAGGGPPTFPVLSTFPGWLTAVQALTSMLNLGQMAVLVIEVVWVYRATTLVRRAGVPTRLSPVWAVAGFFVPLVSLWFPYLAVRDVLVQSPARRRVAWWWAASLAAVPVLFVAVPAAFVATWLAVVMVLVAAVPAVGAPLLLRSVIVTSATVHSELLRAPR